MAEPIRKSWFELITGQSDIILAVSVIGIIAVMIIPMPTTVMDVLLSFNIAFSLVILLGTMYVQRPLELSVFPGLLLVATVFRLSLNVATTRLILSQADAGKVVESFGTFVVSGNYVVGFIIFSIIVVIQFVVITKGAGRVAEVAARFTLDAMPGKQMSIDADLNAGLINEQEARERRLEISKEADFYGAMDGASKFVRGDAIAGIIITLINIIGGLIVGVLQKRMDIMEALATYTRLTVGDGLVTQIPALILSTSAGIIVTRAASTTNLGQEITTQLSARPKAIGIAALMLLIFGLIPGLPKAPFFLLSLFSGGYAYLLWQQGKRKFSEEKRLEAEEVPETEERVEDYLTMDVLEVEIGYALIPIVDKEQGGDLLDRVTTLRRQIAADIGFIVPPIRIRDNIRLKPNDYVLKIKGVEVAYGSLRPGMSLAMNPGTIEEEITGEDVIEPAFGLPAKWIKSSQRQAAEVAGYTVVESSGVLVTHLSEVIKNYAHEILRRQDVHRLVENVRTDHPALLEDLIPSLLNISTIKGVLANLLKERIPINDLITILETIGDYAATTKEPWMLTEFARTALFRTITSLFKDEENRIHVFTIHPQSEQTITNAIKDTPQGLLVNVQPEWAQNFYKNINSLIEVMIANGQQPVTLTAPHIRLAVRKLTEITLPNLTVLSYNEIAPNVEIMSVGVAGVSNEN